MYLLHMSHIPGTANHDMGRSCLSLYQFSVPFFTVHATVQLRIHQSRSHPPVKVAPTSQGRIHQSRSHPPARWHPPVKVASTSQGRIHQSRSHPPVKVAPTSQGHTHQSRSHPPAKVTPTSQGHTNQLMSHPPAKVDLHHGVHCASPLSSRPALSCTVQTGTCHMFVFFGEPCLGLALRAHVVDFGSLLESLLETSFVTLGVPLLHRFIDIQIP